MGVSRSRRLLELLDVEQWSTAQELATKIGRSEKTVRTSLHELNDLLEGHGAHVESRARHGYRLCVDDQDTFAKFLAGRSAARGGTPQNNDERVDYLLMGLLYLMGYVKAQDLCSVFYVSGSTLSSSLKSVEAILAQYDLSLDRKPNHGVRVVGEETSIRRLIAERYVREQAYPAELGDDVPQLMERLARVTRGLLAEHDLPLTEFSFESLMDYCVVARSRILAGFPLRLGEVELPTVDARVHEVAGCLLHAMGVDGISRDLIDEKRYLELYLAGSRTANFGGRNGANFVINERTDRITLEILRLLTNDYGINLLDNFDLRMQLNQHLAPMEIRMRFGMHARNPLLGEIKANYPLAFQMATLAGEVLRRQFGGRAIPEDELGYIALILQLAVERGKLSSKHDVLIASDVGRSSSALLRRKLEQRFGDHLGNIYLCDQFDLEGFNFDKVDFVFTTFPIKTPVPKPVLKIGPFLDEGDARRVENVLRGDVVLDAVDAFVGPQRFLCDLGATTREGVLRELCQRICAAEQVDPNFTDLVFAREELIQIKTGTGVALPHPQGITNDRTFAYVAVLPQRVEWHGEDVRVVILVSMGRADEGDSRRHVLSEAFARFALDAKAVARLVEDPTYQALQAQLEL